MNRAICSHRASIARTCMHVMSSMGCTTRNAFHALPLGLDSGLGLGRSSFRELAFLGPSSLRLEACYSGRASGARRGPLVFMAGIACFPGQPSCHCDEGRENAIPLWVGMADSGLSNGRSGAPSTNERHCPSDAVKYNNMQATC